MEIVKEIIEKNKKDKTKIISILQDIQQEYNYLPKEALEIVSKELLMPLSQIYGIATFFNAFTFIPRGKHLITICLGTACHVRGGPKVLTEAERILKIKSGETTPDNQFTLQTVNCLGACALGPILVVDGKYYGQMSTKKVKDVLELYKK
jgi:NADH-quinone oxidoreductase subunit E